MQNVKRLEFTIPVVIFWSDANGDPFLLIMQGDDTISLRLCEAPALGEFLMERYAAIMAEGTSP